MTLIHTETEYEQALTRLGELWGAAPGTADALELDAVAAAIEAYELRDRHATLPAARPGEVIAFKLRELGWSQRELARRLGWKSSGRVSEIVNGRRGLTLDMVRDLAAVLGIDARLLVHDEGPADDAVWVRIRGPLARCAHAHDYLGFGTLDALAGSLLAGRLVDPSGLRAVPPHGARGSRGGVHDGEGVVSETLTLVERRVA